MQLIQLSPQITRRDVERVLVAAFTSGASDVFFQTGERIRARIHGQNTVMSERPLTATDVATIVNDNVRSTSGSVLAGQPADYADTVALDRVNVVNWRVNATACAVGARDKGIEITYRAIPGTPPSLASLALPQELDGLRTIKDGMVIVVGPTGSGKSTLLASWIRAMLEEGRNRVIRTIEAPIEFVYVDVAKHESNVISQSAVGSDISSFAVGVANCLRRAPTDILIGELRDKETISAGIVAAQTGHSVWTTAHASNVAGTIYRMVNVFDGEDRKMRIVEFLQNLRAIVVQNLLPKIGGGRIALREWLIVDDEFRARLLATPVEQMHSVAAEEVKKRGSSFATSAQALLTRGQIDVAAAVPYLGEASSKLSKPKLVVDNVLHEATFMSNLRNAAQGFGLSGRFFKS
jgi:defect in organelle trafficking protein DotB